MNKIKYVYVWRTFLSKLQSILSYSELCQCMSKFERERNLRVSQGIGERKEYREQSRRFYLPRHWRIILRFCLLRPLGVDIKFNIT